MTHNYFWNGIRYGVFAGTEHEQVLKGLNCNTVIDIGANRGQFALIARHTFPKAKIYAFEPLPYPASIFRKIFKSDQAVHLFETGIGSKKEVRPLYISYKDDSSSFLPIGETQQKIFPGTGHKTTINVEVGPLSEWIQCKNIKNPSLLKIDVQGFELEVLKGSEVLLSLFSYIYVESSFCQLYKNQALAHEIIGFLATRNFILKGIYNLYYDNNGKAIQGDFLFENSSISKT
ncbi:SAM-dependent methyltransferase [Methylacidiphilum caldifontis]|uniref:SAM-dependent methyltransferase n=1 Tax=Methylacidiphilum caldifontis TaxID=2795386 RepID=A0A4Y8P863_9BACT|nr:SAM-dependent methyltransferase [Methylacidiphilum caldifontis]